MFIGQVNQKRVRGFTLLEVTLAVAILAMMSLAIFRFVQANIISVRISSQTAAADARYDGLRELLLAQLQSLPPNKSALTGEPAKLEDRARDEIRWTGGPGPGVLTRYASADFSVWMRLQASEKDSNQLDLGLLRRPKDDPGIIHEHDSWVPLIKNVRSLEIRYFDSNTNIWVDRWPAVDLPRLVKITIERPDAAAPWKVIIPIRRTPY